MPVVDYRLFDVAAEVAATSRPTWRKLSASSVTDAIATADRLVARAWAPAFTRAVEQVDGGLSGANLYIMTEFPGEVWRSIIPCGLKLVL